jgi:hypothetical protein
MSSEAKLLVPAIDNPAGLVDGDEKASDPAYNRLKALLRDAGQSDSLTHSILHFVVESKYDRARSELKRYQESKPHYPQFAPRTARYFEHCLALIEALEIKRGVRGFHQMSVSKQHGIVERVQAQGEDLSHTLKKIEQIERQIKLEDLRSTVIFVRALMMSAMGMMIIFVMVQMTKGIWPTMMVLVEKYSGELLDRVFAMIGL